MADGRVKAIFAQAPLTNIQALVDAEVRLQGVCVSQFNQKRQLLAFRMGVNSVADVIVEEPAPAQPIAVPIDGLLQLSPERVYGHRVRVEGVVTFVQKGEALFIQAKGRNLQVKTDQAGPINLGDRAEVLGFPAFGPYAPILEDGIYRRIGTGPPPTTVKVTADKLLKEEFDADLVTVEGRLINRMQRADEQMLVIEANNLVFTAHLQELAGSDRLAALKNGSRVDLTGICVVRTRENMAKLSGSITESFRILLRTPADIVVLESPPWWTFNRLLWVLAVMGVIILTAVAWALTLSSARPVAE